MILALCSAPSVQTTIPVTSALLTGLSTLETAIFLWARELGRVSSPLHCVPTSHDSTRPTDGLMSRH